MCIAIQDTKWDSLAVFWTSNKRFSESFQHAEVFLMLLSVFHMSTSKIGNLD